MPIPGYLLYCGSSKLVAVLVLTAILGLTDWIDGVMARREGASVLGGLLDPIADKIFIAVLYLPLAEHGIIPLWMAACIFSRDFLVTSLRTSLLLRDAPMRTSVLAKFKTAIQMFGVAYVIIFMIFQDRPQFPWLWIICAFPIVFPLSVVLYRLFTGKKQGLRSVTMALLILLAVGLRYFLGHHTTIYVDLFIITAITVISGFSYLLDAWSALRGKPGNYKEAMRFGLEGILVPVLFVLLLGRFQVPGMSLAIILIVTLELAVGGLGNLLASQKIIPRFRWIALKSILQVLLSGTALAISLFQLDTGTHLGEACIALSLVITVFYSVFSFWRHRAVYLAAI
jgi:phosphatidylglycerophosphate synthase